MQCVRSKSCPRPVASSLLPLCWWTFPPFPPPSCPLAIESNKDKFYNGAITNIVHTLLLDEHNIDAHTPTVAQRPIIKRNTVTSSLQVLSACLICCNMEHKFNFKHVVYLSWSSTLAVVTRRLTVASTLLPLFPWPSLVQ